MQQVERIGVDSLIPYARNSRTHSDGQVAQIAASIREFGFTNPVLVDEAGGIIAGHGRVLAARKLEMADVPCLRLSHLTPAQKRAYVIADNKLALNADWDMGLLSGELAALDTGEFDLTLTGFDDAEFDGLLTRRRESAPRVFLTQPDAAPPLPKVPRSRLGDIWVLERHRLLCGDSTQQAAVDGLLAGATASVILTDPPYCSGGFQEAGRSGGSVGTDAAHKQIANDRLSTRGYMALLKTAFECCGAPFMYVFTDWRMWVYLFDVVESSGYGVRSMIVWDKGSPGMGRGWRAQHELVMFGSKATPPFDKHGNASGNVISASRTGNKYHTTEKPVELLDRLLKNTSFAKIVVDPFTGSGSTLIACEQADRTFLGAELDPAYVDVAVKRWQNFTGKQAVRESDGAKFDEVAQ